MHDERASALHAAIASGDLDAVKACLESGTPATAPDWSGVSALARAAQGGNPEIVSLLLAHGAEVNDHERDGGLALHGSLRHAPDSRILDMLLERGVSPRARVRGRTAVMEAARVGALDFVRRLVALGVDPHAIANDGRTALDEAVSRQRRDVEACLRGLGVEERQAGRRALVEGLLRAFGGKATEVSGGKWLVDPKRLGPKVQVQVDAASTRVVVHSLRFRASVLSGAEPGILRIWHRDTGVPVLAADSLPGSSPSNRGRPPRDLPEAFRNTPLRAARRADAGEDSVAALLSVCREAEPLLAALELAQGDELVFGAEAIVLHCAGHDPALAVRRAAALEDLTLHLAFERTRPSPALADVLTVKVGRRLRADDPSGEAGHRWGGLPTARRACPDCSARLGCVIRLDLRDERLAGVLPGLDSLEVLACHDCGDWGPVFNDHSHAGPERIGGESVEGDDRGEHRAPCVPARELRLEASKSRSGARSRIGGAPSWLQGDDTPACPRCLRSMAFVLQLMSRADIAFGDQGRLYVFTCAGCRMSATMIQSH